MKAFVAVLLTLASSVAHASVPAEVLLQGLKKSLSADEDERYSYEAGVAIGYVTGLAQLAQKLKIYCPAPDTVGTRELAAAIVALAERSPKFAREPAEILVSAALSEHMCKTPSEG